MHLEVKAKRNKQVGSVHKYLLTCCGGRTGDHGQTMVKKEYLVYF